MSASGLHTLRGCGWGGGVGEMAQSIERLPCKHKDPSSIPRAHVKNAECSGMCLQPQHKSEWLGLKGQPD